MKSVVIISTIRFYNSNTASVRRTSNYAQMLNDNGIEVVFSSLLEFDDDAVLHSVKGKSLQQILYSVKAIEAQYNFRHQLPKVKQYFQFIKNLFSPENTILILYPSKDTLFDVLVYRYLIKKQKYKVIYELNEIRKYAYIIYQPKGLIKYTLNWLNEMLLAKFSGIICISSNIVSFISIRNKHFIHIPILLDANQLIDFKGQYNKDTTFKIGFAGTIGHKKENLENFFLALKILWNTDYHNIECNIFGKFSENEMKRIRKSIDKNQLSQKVHFKGQFEPHDLVKQLSMQHLLILPRNQTLQNKYGFSTKLSDYLLAGIPILLTDVSDNLKYFQDGFNSMVACKGKPEEYAEKITQIIEHYNKLAPIISQNASLTAKQYFDYKNFSKAFIEFIQNTDER